MIYNIKNESGLFESFFKYLRDSHYVINIDVASFTTASHVLTHKSPDAFMVGCLAANSLPVKGTLQKVDFTYAFELISEMFCRASNGGINPGSGKERFYNITKNFWSAIESIVALSPEISYEHLPDEGSLFYSEHMWNEVFIFISGAQGLIFAISASD